MPLVLLNTTLCAPGAKMAPAVCTAQRLPVLFTVLLSLIISISYKDVLALLVYDRQALLVIRDQHELFLKQVNRGNQSSVPPPLLSASPMYLQRSLYAEPRRKRQRRRGKRGGVVVRVRAYLRSTPRSGPVIWRDFHSNVLPSLDYTRRCVLQILPRDAKEDRCSQLCTAAEEYLAPCILRVSSCNSLNSN